MKITNITAVEIYDADTSDLQWAGEFGSFVSDNSMEQDEIETIAADLVLYGAHIGGGGAAPAFIMCLAREEV